MSINTHLSAKQAALIKQNEEINAKVEEIGQRTTTPSSSSTVAPAASSSSSHPLLAATANSSANSSSSSLTIDGIAANLTGPGSNDSVNSNASTGANSSPSPNSLRKASRARMRDRGAIDNGDEPGSASVQQSVVEHGTRARSSSIARKGQTRIHSERRTPKERVAGTPNSSKKKHGDNDGAVNAVDQPEPLMENIDPYSSEIPEGLGAEATIRYQKARLRVLQDELDVAHSNLKTALGNNATLTTKVEDLTRDKEEITKKLQQTTQLMDKHRELVSAQEDKQQVLETQLATTQQRMEELERNEKQTSQQFRSKDVRLNRALEELERVKTQLQEERSLKTDQLVPKAELENLQRENKKLVKQKNELLVAFKKQIKLIDILKRQRIHMEAAKMLSFTEEEFSKALELGPT